jgi:hypothetical protein
VFLEVTVNQCKKERVRVLWRASSFKKFVQEKIDANMIVSS